MVVIATVDHARNNDTTWSISAHLSYRPVLAFIHLQGLRVRPKCMLPLCAKKTLFQINSSVHTFMPYIALTISSSNPPVAGMCLTNFVIIIVRIMLAISRLYMIWYTQYEVARMIYCCNLSGCSWKHDLCYHNVVAADAQSKTLIYIWKCSCDK